MKKKLINYLLLFGWSLFTIIWGLIKKQINWHFLLWIWPSFYIFTISIKSDFNCIFSVIEGFFILQNFFNIIKCRKTGKVRKSVKIEKSPKIQKKMKLEWQLKIGKKTSKLLQKGLQIFRVLSNFWQFWLIFWLF